MHISKKLMLLLLALGVPGSSGCSLSRNAPLPQYYLLNGNPRAAGALLPGGPAAPAVGLRPARLADYLDTPFIVVRRGSHRLEFSEFHRWGEDLAGAMNAAVAGLLAADAPTWHIRIAPWASESQPDYLVQLHLLSFEGVVGNEAEASAGEAHLQATWEIFRRSDGALMARGSTEVRDPGWTVDDFDELVGRLDEGLAALAQALLADLQRVVAGGD